MFDVPQTGSDHATKSDMCQCQIEVSFAHSHLIVANGLAIGETEPALCCALNKCVCSGVHCNEHLFWSLLQCMFIARTVNIEMDPHHILRNRLIQNGIENLIPSTAPTLYLKPDSTEWLTVSQWMLWKIKQSAKLSALHRKQILTIKRARLHAPAIFYSIIIKRISIKW